jgi:hypothetical protein
MQNQLPQLVNPKRAKLIAPNCQHKWHRYHRYDLDTLEKSILNVPYNTLPEIMTEPGYSMWVRGTGAQNNKHYDNLKKALINKHKGVPKSTEAKQKMSAAKMGKPLSAEHKESMRLEWKTRRQRIGKANREKYLRAHGLEHMI